MELYRDMKATERFSNERNDCSVFAVALATGTPYAHTHALFRAAGRRDRQGTYRHQQMTVVTRLGFTAVKHTPRQPSGACFTPKTIGQWVNPNKRYLAYVRGHVFAIIDGKVQDWTEGRQHRIKEVLEIHPINANPAEDVCTPISPVRQAVKFPRPKSARTAPPKRGKGATIWAWLNAGVSEFDVRINCVEEGINPVTVTTVINDWKRFQVKGYW
jgi:hypothetical protein